MKSAASTQSNHGARSIIGTIGSIMCFYGAVTHKANVCLYTRIGKQ